MNDYNLKEADKWFIKTAAWLTVAMNFEAKHVRIGVMEQRRLEGTVENWRNHVVKIICQHQLAHKRISYLEGQLRTAGIKDGD